MNTGKISAKVAVCGILTALSVIFMVLASFLGVLTYTAPMVAGGLLIVPVKEYGTKTALTMFAAVSLLGLMLVTDKELAIFYVLLFGYYPILQPALNRVDPRPLRALLKAAVFNGSALLSVWLAEVIFSIPVFEGDNPTWLLAVGYLAVANVCFALYDKALLGFYTFYDVKVRVWLGRLFRF